MPTFHVTGPDGATYEVNAPDGATEQDAIAYAQSQAKPAAQAPNATRQAMGAAMPMLGGQFLPDLAMGARQPLDAAAQMLGRSFGSDSADKANAAAMAGYKQQFGEIPGSDLGRGVGSMLTTAPALPMRAAGVLGTALQGAGGGAIGGALSPIYDAGADFWSQKGQQAKEGALVGGATAGALGLGGKVFGPTDAARALRAEGVTPTIGQQMGGWWKPLEEKATSIPIVGDAIKMGQAKGLDDFNRAIYNRVLAPLGESYKGPVGQEGIAAVGDRLSAAYENLLPKMAPTVIDAPFVQGAEQLKSMLASTPSAAERFQTIYQREVLNKITDGGTLPPSAMKDVESRLGFLARSLKSSIDSDQNLAGRAVDELQSGLRQMVARSNPDMAPKLQAINNGWAQLVQLENAAKSVKVARNEGVVTPADYLKGIKAGDTSARDRVFSRGEAMNQDLAQAADKTLSSTYPNSGTIDRAIIAGGGLGYLSPETLLGAGAATLPYLPGIRNVVASGSGLLGNLAKIAPYFGLLSPTMTPQGLLGNR